MQNQPRDTSHSLYALVSLRNDFSPFPHSLSWGPVTDAITALLISPGTDSFVLVGNHRYDLSLYFFFLHSLPQVMLFSNILTHLLPRKPLKFSIIRLLNPYETVTLYQHLPQRGAISNSYPFFRMEPTRNLASPHLF